MTKPLPYTLIVRKCMRGGKSAHAGFVWPMSGKVACNDWKPTLKVGNGLHGYAWGRYVGTNMPNQIRNCRGGVWLLVKVLKKDLICLEGGTKYKFSKGTVICSGSKRKVFGALVKDPKYPRTCTATELCYYACDNGVA